MRRLAFERTVARIGNLKKEVKMKVVLHTRAQIQKSLSFDSFQNFRSQLVVS